jgi:Uma2 family endonuclease
VTKNGGTDAKVCRVHLLPISPANQIMAMPVLRTPHRRWTEEEFYRARDAAPPGERWELVDGEVLVTPSPHWSHQRVVVELAVLLHAYVRKHALGELFVAPLDVKLEPGLVLQPDVLVVPTGELETHADEVRRLLLAVESVSPTSARHDRVTKRPRYQRNRVPEYWVVDATSETIERWRPDDARPELLAEQLAWHPEGASEPFVLDLVRFFASVAVEGGTGGT